MLSHIAQKQGTVTVDRMLWNCEPNQSFSPWNKFSQVFDIMTKKKKQRNERASTAKGAICKPRTAQQESSTLKARSEEASEGSSLQTSSSNLALLASETVRSLFMFNPPTYGTLLWKPADEFFPFLCRLCLDCFKESEAMSWLIFPQGWAMAGVSQVAQTCIRNNFSKSVICLVHLSIDFFWGEGYYIFNFSALVFITSMLIYSIYIYYIYI